jgi:unsaturated rhamnogalacturonyl hydrolase
LATELADQWIADEPAEDQYWDWMDAVYMLGFVALAEAEAEAGAGEGYLDYPTAWVDTYYDEVESAQRFPDASDRVVPNTVAAELMRLTGEDSYPACIDNVELYLETAPRSDDGAILHWGTHLPDRRELLIDSLFMIGSFLLSRYHSTGDEAYLDLFTEQLAIFDTLLRDDAEGLFIHAWDDEDDVRIPDGEATYWARGNGWILAVTAWYLDVAPDDHADRAYVEQIYLGEVDAFVRYQDGTGLMYTVLNRPGEGDNYLETSSTALFATGVARGLRLGVLDETTYRAALAAAIDGIRGQIVQDADGHLTTVGTSYGTVPTTFDNYVLIPLVDDLNLGVGTVLMALAEADGL